MRRCFYDTETVGYHGPIVLIQYAFDDGPIVLHEVWRRPIRETLALIDEIMACENVGFNLVFDHFHMVQLYTTFITYVKLGGSMDDIPEDHINELAVAEERARFCDSTIKPVSSCDLFLWARKTKYQSLMGRKDIRIKRIPTVLAPKLADKLKEMIPIDPIYFGKRGYLWQVEECEDDQFSDVVLRFKASTSLKNLAEYALGVKSDTVLRMTDVEISKKYHPVELGYAPFALAVSTAEKGWRAMVKIKGVKKVGKAWPGVIKHHISHWGFYEPARQYATADVDYTRRLWEHLDKPEAGDDDSELAIAVACCRWSGFSVDIDMIKQLRIQAYAKMAKTPIAPKPVKAYITEPMNETERLGFGDSTAKAVLEKMVSSQEWACDCTFDDQGNFGTNIKADCPICGGTGRHPSSTRAEEVLGARAAKKEIEVYDKIIKAGRLHASFKVIGALSGRMSGADGLNPQAFKRDGYVRVCFTFADEGEELDGGDFDSYEVCIADAVYDGALREDILSGKKIHALMAMEMYPGMGYDAVLADKRIYTLGKNGVFSMIYMGDWTTLVRKYGVEEENAKAAFNGFIGKRPGIRKAQQRIIDSFGPLKQPGGIGTKVSYTEPLEYVESLYGFRRYFTLENRIIKALFDLATKIPQEWRDIKIKVMRRLDRGPQWVGGAVSSALYGAAYGVQGSNIRAAGNHEIQSTGSTGTKKMQRKIWDLQPPGYHPILVKVYNSHDEIECVRRPEMKDAVKAAVDSVISEIKTKIPLVAMEWKQGMKNWSEK